MDILGGIKKLFQDLTNYFKSIYDGIIEFFTGIWNWFKSVVESFESFIKDCFETAFDFVVETVTNTCTWVIEQITFLGQWLWETAIYLLDCSVKGFVGFIDWVFGLFPDLEVPGNFDQGVTYFIQFGMILNSIFPIAEGLFMLGILFAVLAITAVVRLVLYVYRLIPFKFS